MNQNNPMMATLSKGAFSSKRNRIVTMIKISKNGSLPIPVRLRKKYNLEVETEVVFLDHDGVLSIVPRSKFDEIGGFQNDKPFSEISIEKETIDLNQEIHLLIGSHNVPRDAIQMLCRKWKISQLDIFGAAVTGEFTEISEINLLGSVNFDPKFTLMDHTKMVEELETIFQRRVIFVHRAVLDYPRNKDWRTDALNSAKTIFLED